MTIHVATSADLGRLVRRGLREPVAFVSDNWLVGPCAPSPAAHPGVRCDYWGLQGRERTRLARSFREIMTAIDSPDRVVVWISRFGSDTIAFWALCAWRLLRWPDKPNLGLVVLGGPTEAEEATGVRGGFLRATPADARRSNLDQVRSLSLTEVRESALLWRRVSGRSPIVAGRDVRPTRQSKQLFELGAYQAGFFPRVGARGLALSRFDELLFACLGKQWSTAADVFVSRGAAGEELRHRWLSLTGDIFLSIRLAQWATPDRGTAALSSEPLRADNRMMAARYRVSEMGEALAREGLGEIGRGALLPLWGATAYDPLDPWVVVDSDAGAQRIQRPGRSLP